MMNKSSIDTWLESAIEQLVEAAIPSARLDAELILTHTIRKPRTWLHAHGDELLEDRHREIANARLDLRLDRVPIAYIVGHKDFYGRRFEVTTATLIPRPESEAIISLLEKIDINPTARTVDVGTGSGCIGITAKLERPKLEVTLVDIDPHALVVAGKNAERLGAEVTTMKSDLLSNYPYQPELVLANLPYVDAEWERSPETNHEPPLALFASDNGLKLIKQLIDQCVHKLAPNGHLLIEADNRQHHFISAYAEQKGFKLINSEGLVLAYQKVSG